ncbi:MAG: hypothetical protein ABI378_13935 [Chitinophagaceae bacterium]
MSLELVRYHEPLQEEERAFLIRKETRDRRQFFKVLQIVLVICFILPFAMAWGEAIVGKPNPFSFKLYFIGVGTLVGLTTGAALVSYRSNLYLLYRDLRANTKTIERTTISRKYLMRPTQKCFFYLNSKIRLSIEVSEEDFDNFEVGDEVNIEYATFSKSYFGYF